MSQLKYESFEMQKKPSVDSYKSSEFMRVCSASFVQKDYALTLEIGIWITMQKAGAHPAVSCKKLIEISGPRFCRCGKGYKLAARALDGVQSGLPALSGCLMLREVGGEI